MGSLPKGIYMLSVFPTKISMTFLTEIEGSTLCSYGSKKDLE
jgi:hypothetical protein